MRNKPLLIGLVALFLAFGLPAARAAEHSANCDLSERVELLGEVKKKADGSVAGVKTEAEVRRELLKKVIECAIADSKTLQSTVRDLDSKDEDILKIKARFTSSLDRLLEYYADQEIRAKDVGLQGSKIMAKNLKNWRENTYAPMAEETTVLVLWVKNQSLFATAKNRLDQITQTVKALKLMDEENIKKLLDEAGANYKEAAALNAGAKQGLLDSIPSSESIGRIKGSLEALAKTYKNFFDLSEAVKKLLPI